jgi:hypothetical protein
VSLFDEPLVVGTLARHTRADLLEDGALVALVHAPRHTLRVVHPNHERLPTLLA